MNKIRCEKDEIAMKLRKATHVKKSLQQELNAKYRDFGEMQIEIDRLNEENKILSQKVTFYESNVNNDDKSNLIENQRLQLTVNQLEEKLHLMTEEMNSYKQENGILQTQQVTVKLREELEQSHNTIDTLQKQIAELRLNIEQQQKIQKSIRLSGVAMDQSTSKEASPDVTHTNNAVLQMNLHKLQSQLILIKSDKVSMQQLIQQQQTKFNGFKDECYKQFKSQFNSLQRKINKLQKKLDECNDEKNLFESQYQQVREERDELREENEKLHRPPDELLDELQNELLNQQHQADIDNNHYMNQRQELENKKQENEELRELNRKLDTNWKQREQDIINDYNNQIKELQQQISSYKELNNKLEADMDVNTKSISSISLNKIDQMNPSQLKDTLKNMKRTVRELQTKMSSIERKRDVHEKTAQKYTKRCNDWQEKHKRLNREYNSQKSELMKLTQLNKRLKKDNDKLSSNVKKIQKEITNGKDLNRKVNMTTTRLESLQNKHKKLGEENSTLKEEKKCNLQKIEQLQIDVNNMKTMNNKLEQKGKEFEKKIETFIEEKKQLIEQVTQEKALVQGFKDQCTKFFNQNALHVQRIEADKANMQTYEERIAELEGNVKDLNKEKEELNKQIQSKDNKFEELNIELNDNKQEYEQKLSSLREQNDNLKVSLDAMKESDNIQRNEIDETNKIIRDQQTELKEIKNELREYQNKWQFERKQNDEHTEKLRQFELKSNNLLHQLQVNHVTIESKSKEIDRLNAEFKEQQKNLLKTISELADTKARLETFNNEIDKVKQENQLLIKEKERLEQNLDNKLEILEKMQIENGTEKEKLRKQISEYKQEIKEIKSKTSQNSSKLEKNIKELKMEINDYRNKIEQITKKQNEVQNKYDTLRQQNKTVINNLDEKEHHILDLEEQIEDLNLGLQKLEKESNYKLNKKISELDEATNALCDLQKEYDSKCKEMDENNNLRKQQTEIYTKIENERNNLQIQYTELIKKYEACSMEIEATKKKLNEMENNSKLMQTKLQQTSLQNDRLKDDLDAINNSKDHGTLEKKYAILKQEANKRGEMIQVKFN